MDSLRRVFARSWRFLAVMEAGLLGLAALGGSAGFRPAHAQPREDEGPRIGVIDFYGLRTVPEEKIRRALGVHEGGPLPSSKNDTELRLEGLPGIVVARLQAVCCENGKAILYVGIEEKGSPHFAHREPPVDPVLLPGEIHDTYALFLAALNDAVAEEEVEEDLTQGHALMKYAPARAHQERFVELAGKHLDVIRDVLRNSFNEEHRAIAAYVIGYAAAKKDVVPDLLYALRDPDETVRNNAMRSLAAFEVLAKTKPTAGIEIPPTWLIEMVNSVIWTDRATAAVSLVNLTEHGNAEVLAQLRTRSLDALLDMARWKHLPHALPAYILLGRMLGLPEEEIQRNWTSQERLSLVERAAALRARSAGG